MLLAHKIELRPTPAQADYLDRACGSRRHAYNQLLAHFSQPGVTWSKRAALTVYHQLRAEFPWYQEVSQRVTRNAIDDLDNAFNHFFRRIREGKKPGFPTFKKRGVHDSFALREKPKFDVDDRTLRVEKLKSRIKLRQRLRFTGTPCQVTISKRAAKYFASILVDTQDYDPQTAQAAAVGVDFGITALAVCAEGVQGTDWPLPKLFPANQQLKRNLKRLRRKQRALSRKQKGSNRFAKAKQAVAKLHYRISNQRKAMLHAVSHYLTAHYQVITLEDLNVSGMVRNRKLARAIQDAGFGELRRQITYKAELRGCTVVIADRWFPSSKQCSVCGHRVDTLPLSVRRWRCPACHGEHDRDHNAAANLAQYGRDTLQLDRSSQRVSAGGSIPT